MNILDNFKLRNERELFETVLKNIDSGVELKGTNLWILVIAIFIASLGLNVNSTAVIIGAMLISPLMGPIMGLGFGMAINDLVLLRKSLLNYLLSAGIGLLASTIYFLLSPINDAHSEILARTAPNVYDVLIALFGGFAGSLAISSRMKGNVIPGVAIATALMPPLCTAGYGLSTLQFNFFFGAFYLFIINSVFIALAILITSWALKFPSKYLPNKKDSIKAKGIVWAIVLITLLPSIYFAYDLNRQNKFQKRANAFIDHEAIFPNDFLLKKNINSKNETITLTYGGDLIEEDAIASLKSKLKKYSLSDSALEVRQGFAYLGDNNNNEETKQLSAALTDREMRVESLQKKIDSINARSLFGRQINAELKAQYPAITSSIIQQAENNNDTSHALVWLATIQYKGMLLPDDKIRIKRWLEARVNTNDIKISFEK